MPYELISQDVGNNLLIQNPLMTYSSNLFFSIPMTPQGVEMALVSFLIVFVPVQCDFCKAVLNKKTDDDSQDNIEATLPDKEGKNKKFELCNEGCLLGFLQARADRKKTKKTSKGSIFEIDLSKK